MKKMLFPFLIISLSFLSCDSKEKQVVPDQFSVRLEYADTPVCHYSEITDLCYSIDGSAFDKSASAAAGGVASFPVNVTPSTQYVDVCLGSTAPNYAVASSVQHGASAEEDFALGMRAFARVSDFGQNQIRFTPTPVTVPVRLSLYDSKYVAAGEKIKTIRFKADSPIVGSATVDFATGTFRTTATASEIVMDCQQTSLEVGTQYASSEVGIVTLPANSVKLVVTVVTSRNTYTFTMSDTRNLTAGVTELVSLDFSNPDKLPQRRIAVFGDSISTFDGYSPHDYGPYYPVNDRQGTGTVQTVDKTYWYQVIYTYCRNSILDANRSWGGTTVVTREGRTNGFLQRVTELSNPDMIILHGGTNDHNYKSELGTFDWDLTIDQLDETKFRSAYIKVIRRFQQLYPGVKILIVVGDFLSAPYALSVIQIAEHFNLPYADFTNRGTVQNDKVNIPKSTGSHPDATGHAYMARVISETLADYLP